MRNNDTRLLDKPIHRRIVLDILDNTPIDIPDRDLDAIAEELEGVLQKYFDVKIDCITVEQRVRD